MAFVQMRERTEFTVAKRAITLNGCITRRVDAPKLASYFFMMFFGVNGSALAGPPFVSDDPEPTDYKHFEIYDFDSGTTVRSGTNGQSGIDFNYGAAPDLQLTATFPVGFSFASSTAGRFGLSNIELVAKYRFVHQSDIGWDVAVFPRIFLPSASNQVGDKEPSLLFPLWVQRDLGSGWTTFGGGGCQIYSGSSVQNSCMAGWVLMRKVLANFQIGGEIVHNIASRVDPASTTLGIGAIYDLNNTYHLLGYLRTGVQNREETGRLSWYSALLITF